MHKVQLSFKGDQQHSPRSLFGRLSVVSLALSILDYCNTLLAGHAASLHVRFQDCRNYTKLGGSSCLSQAETLPYCPSIDGTSPASCSWPHNVRTRGTRVQGPQWHLSGYITDLLCWRRPTRDPCLRQLHDSLQLVVQPSFWAASAWSFAHTAPPLWNVLPFDPRASE